jgi:hypothetical protein
MWALGYDGAKPQLWNEIEKRYKPLSVYDMTGIYKNQINFTLEQNYPNPFNPSTKIRFHIPTGIIDRHFSTIRIYNNLGEELAIILNELLAPGSYEVEFNLADYNLPSGVYFYQLRSGKFVETKKMILLK